MYPRNGSSPPPIRAKVISATDGSPITSGVVAYHVQGSTRSAVGGSAASHVANGIWVYTPTQAETNYTTFGIEFYHTSAVGYGPLVEVATEEVNATTGVASVDVKGISGDATAADNLETACDGGSFNLGGGGVVAASVTGSVGSVAGSVAGNVAGSVGSLGAQAKQDVNAEVDAALQDIGLDHLLAASVTAGDVATNSVVAKLASKSDPAAWSSYDNATDSLEALRDRGDSAWITATGFSTHSAADVWAVADRKITGLTAAALADFFDTDSGTTYAAAVSGSVVKEIADNAGGSTLTAEAVADAVWDELSTGHTDAGKAGAQLWTKINDVLADTAEIGAAGAGLTAVPWNAAWDAEVQSECADAIAAAGLSTLTADEVWSATERTLTAFSFSVTVSDKTGFSLAAAERQDIADAVLGRSVANVEASAAEHSLCTVVLACLESAISGTTWTIKRTNGSTTHATKTVTTDPDADPITGVS